MRKSAMFFLLLIAVTGFLVGCNNGAECVLQNTGVDSLKDSLEAYRGTDYKDVEKIAKKGMVLSVDSSDYYYFMTFYASSLMWTNDVNAKDSLLRLIENYVKRATPTCKINDVQARYYLLKGNAAILSHQKGISVDCCKKAVAFQQKGTRCKNVAIMLTNLSDGYLENSDYANGAACLRRALLLSDSLQLKDAKIQAINGLAMIYLGLRNFKESDKYFRLGETMLPMMRGRQKFFYYNSRGNYYYYYGDYVASLNIFRMMNQNINTIAHSDYDRNLLWVNLADVYIKNGYIDSALVYQKKCESFYEKNKNQAALY